jgi:IS1 family transposase
MSYGVLLIKKTLSENDLEQEYGASWIWTALDPNTRLIICHYVGDRTLESCRAYFRRLLERINNKPLFVSDELVDYKTVLQEHYSTEVQVPPTGKRGRPRKPKKVLDPEIDYATVHKTRENGSIIKVERKIVFGDIERIQEKLLQSVSHTINTSYIERSNGTLRQMNSHLRRKSLTFAKEKSYFQARLNIIIFVYNFIRPHNTLSKNPDKTRTPRTPALAAGIIEHNWTFLDAFKRPLIKSINV